ncbi:MAG: succinate dehydrogenase cytochrome b subunit [Bacteroidia bacterium]|nr:succinate dehydrogenase cytochrome b subunit [Bacteroidia bacterium]
MSKETFLTSTLGRKLLMGLTGLFLIGFLVVHVSLNSLIFLNDHGATFNKGAHFMSHNIVIRIMEVGLFAGLIAHMVLALQLTLKNNKARPVKYAMTNGNANSSWYSRSMGILGSLLLMFLVVHLANFWIPTKIAVFNETEHNTFEDMKVVFSKWYFVSVYMVGVIALSYHLLHGFQSAFQSLGMNHRKYSPLVRKVGILFAIGVPVIFAAMPLVIAFGLIK